MKKEVEVFQEQLSITDPTEFLHIFTNQYYTIWTEEPDKIIENLKSEQISLMFYKIIYDQVQNGGFLQLLFNGYGFIVMEGSPMSEALREWGAAKTAEILDKVSQHSEEVLNFLEESGYNMENFSKIYKQFPHFDEFDKEFYKNDGLLEVADYVKNNINMFADILE